MNIVMTTVMMQVSRLCMLYSLLLVGRVTSLPFCDDYCCCDIPNLLCSRVDFNRALNHTIPSNVSSSTTSIEILFFNETALSLGNDTFQNFHALQRLTIRHYQLTFASEYIFEGLNNLSYIYFESNVMTEIPKKELSRSRTSLQELHLVSQKMRNISANSFVQLSNLRELTIRNNFHILDVSPDAFCNLTHLTNLDLSKNDIGILHDTTFMSLPNLQELDLSYNLLAEVPTAIHALMSLTKLDMSYNRFLDNPRNLKFLVRTPKLHTLQMEYCAISEISSDAVQNLNTAKSLTVANFDGNPFNCTGDLCSFASWYLSLPEPSTSTQSPPPGKGPYQCKGSGQSFQNFYDESCVSTSDPSTTNVPDDSTPWHLIAIAITVILVALVVAIVSFVVWKFRLLNQYQHRFGIYFQRRVHYGAMGDNNEYSFDAYVSHHEEDKSFVEDDMLPRLEDENDFELCVSFRNFCLGSNLLENVSSAQDVSRAIIFIINERFMQNSQCKLELEMASTRMLEDEMNHGGQRLILILMEVLSPELVNNTLRMLLNHVHYLEWDPTAEEKCWGQLIATLRTMVPVRKDNEQLDAHDEHNAGNELEGIEHCV